MTVPYRLCVVGVMAGMLWAAVEDQAAVQGVPPHAFLDVLVTPIDRPRTKIT